MGRLDDITLFLHVLDRGSISAAARSLDISVAVASARLQGLERDLGVRLLHRTTRKLRPTAEGILLAQQGRALVEDLVALTEELRTASRGISGALRLTMSSTFGRLYISPLLPEFLARYPAVKINVDLNDQLRDLASADVDLAIRIGTLEDSNLVARKLANNRRVLCASPDYLRKSGSPATPSDLESHECLILDDTLGKRNLWRLNDAEKNEHIVRVHGRIESNQGELLREAALAGLGISMHSTWHIWEDLNSGRLQIVLPNYPIADTGVYAVFPQRRLVPARVKAFVDFLLEHFGEVPPWERDGTGGSGENSVGTQV